MKGKAEEMYRVYANKRRKHFGDAAKKEKTKVYDTYLPLTFSKLPSGHGAHFSLPSTAAKVPGEQDLHCEAEVEPGVRFIVHVLRRWQGRAPGK